MFSRRSFLAASLALMLQPPWAIAKKRVPVEVKKLGPHSLVREQWPPAISPDFVEIVDKGYALLSDQSGRLAIVDLKREQGPKVIGELNGIGKKVIDVAINGPKLYALTAVESDSDSDVQYSIAVIDLSAQGEPRLEQRVSLPYMTDPTAIAAAAELVAVGGATGNGTDGNAQNQVLLFSFAGKRRSDEGNQPLATLNVSSPVVALDLQERQLLILQQRPDGGALDVYNMSNSRAPAKIATLKLDGTYSIMTRNKDMLALGGTVAGPGSEALRRVDVRLLSMKPAPHLVSQEKLPLSELMDLVAQKKQLLALGTQGGRLAVLPLTIGKTWALSAGQPVVLPSGSRGVSAKARMAANEKQAYIAADSGSVQVLTIKNNGWEYTYSHVIPRLPVASVAISATAAVLAGADIKTYDLSEPYRPVLVGTAETSSVVRSIAIADTLLLALTRDALSLRKLAKPSDVVASLRVDGQKMAYDPAQHKAYVLLAGEKQTTVTPVRVTGTLVAELKQTLPGVYSDSSAFNGKLLVGGLSNLALYDMDGTTQLGTRVFPNLAIRDMALLGDVAVITAVDAASRGFLLTINATAKDLPTIGSVDLPQDAVAIAVNGSQAVVVGRSDQGKDEASVVDLSNSAAPHVLATFPVLEAASAVAIKGKWALVGGRGMEILSL